MRGRQFISLMVLAASLCSCQSTVVGPAEQSKAYPPVSDAEMEQALANNPEALAAYRETQNKPADRQ